MKETFFVSLDIYQAVKTVYDEVIEGSFSGELLDSYTMETQCGKCIVNVFEKLYMRASNYLTLTVIFDDFEDKTRVHFTAGGGGQGLLNIDWGAAGSFAGTAVKALEPYRID